MNLVLGGRGVMGFGLGRGAAIGVCAVLAVLAGAAIIAIDRTERG